MQSLPAGAQQLGRRQGRGRGRGGEAAGEGGGGGAVGVPAAAGRAAAEQAALTLPHRHALPQLPQGVRRGAQEERQVGQVGGVNTIILINPLLSI